MLIFSHVRVYLIPHHFLVGCFVRTHRAFISESPDVIILTLAMPTTRTNHFVPFSLFLALIAASASLAQEESFDMTILNTHDALYDKRECMLFLYSMTAQDTQVWTIHKSVQMNRQNNRFFKRK